MPLALRYRHDPAPTLVPLSALVVARETSAAFLAALRGRTEGEMQQRFVDGHRAYVARHDGEPAAWGWVATRTARIGELDAAISLPRGDRYLWNFVTLEAHRGRGIYPRLLDAIVRAECAGQGEGPDHDDRAMRFWIAYAPENHASGAGMRKAGFANVAELSFDREGRPALHVPAERGIGAVGQVFGLPVVGASLAPCWRCVRAGGRGMHCRPGECRCDYQRPEAGCAA
jgi:GNAT superfamily N-acetyltransferase